MSRVCAGHFVYILQCADGTLYTGYACDPRKREQVHNTGRGARYTAGRRPVLLVYSEACKSVGEALRREHEVKRWSRARKETLIAASRARAGLRRASVLRSRRVRLPPGAQSKRSSLHPAPTGR